MEKNIKKGIIVSKILRVFFIFLFLLWVFFQNSSWVRLACLPFLFCALANIGEYIGILLQKEKVTKIFRFLFRLSFFVYYFGFLIFATIYLIKTKEYSLFLPILLFLLGGLYFVRQSFKKQAISSTKHREKKKKKYGMLKTGGRK